MIRFIITVTFAILALLAVSVTGICQQDTAERRIARLEARVSTLEAALAELHGNIKEYRFETTAGKFICGRCKLEEEK